MIVHVEIKTNNPRLAFEIFGMGGKVATGDVISIPGGPTLKYLGQMEYRSLDMPTILLTALEFGSGVAVGVLSNWIYEKLKGKTNSITIDRIEIELNKGEIEKILKEKIKINK